MSRPKPTFNAITSLDALNLVISEVSHQKLVIIDFHLDWSGPTAAITSFCNQLWTDFDDPDKRLAIYTVSRDLEGIEKRAQSLCDAEMKVAKQGCKPLFLVIRNGLCTGTVDGLNTASLRSVVELNIPGRKVVPKK